MSFAKRVHTLLNQDIIHEKIIKFLFRGISSDARKSYLKRLVKKGELLRIKRNLYLIPAEDRIKNIHSFEIANYIMLPSYVSQESALSFYGLIPETPYTTTSVTPGRSREFHTCIGNFSFNHLPMEKYNNSYYQFIQDDNKFLIATPLKALIDYILLKRKTYKSLSEIEEDLRINSDTLSEYVNSVKPEKMILLKNANKKNRPVQKFLKIIETSIINRKR